jgi:hypothetical protein
MISLSTARKLKQAGLNWIPALHDFFAIPDRGLDDRVFVISDMMAYVEVRNNIPIVTFHGTLEWALDYLLTSEVIWLPQEEQLRIELIRLISRDPQSHLMVESIPAGFRCEIQFAGGKSSFEAAQASEAYAQTLIYLLQSHSIPGNAG